MTVIWFIVSILSFSITYFAPGDPLYMYMTPGATGHKMSTEELQSMRESLGLTGSAAEQYMRWCSRMLRGNWGISIQTKEPVLELIAGKLPCTMGLMGCSLLLSLIIAVPLGLIAGTHRNGPANSKSGLCAADGIISGITYAGISVPAFWLGIMLIILFSMKLRLLPSSGMRTIGVSSSWDLIKHGIMPVIVLSMNNTAVLVRYIRANTIAQMGEEYVLTAISKGLSMRRVMFCHVLKNCMLPVITVLGSRFGTLVTGSFIIESVFSWPGLGTLGMTAVNNRDYPVVMGITALSCAMLLLGNFLADILYSFADPRIKTDIIIHKN